MAGPCPDARRVSLAPAPWSDLVQTALGGAYPAEHWLEDMMNLLEGRK